MIGRAGGLVGALTQPSGNARASNWAGDYRACDSSPSAACEEFVRKR